MNVLEPIGAEARKYVDKLAGDLTHHLPAQERTMANETIGDALHRALWNVINDHHEKVMADVSQVIDQILTPQNMARAVSEALNIAVHLEQAPPPAEALTPLPAADPVKPTDPDANPAA